MECHRADAKRVYKKAGIGNSSQRSKQKITFICDSCHAAGKDNRPPVQGQGTSQPKPNSKQRQPAGSKRKASESPPDGDGPNKTADVSPVALNSPTTCFVCAKGNVAGLMTPCGKCVRQTHRTCHRGDAMGGCDFVCDECYYRSLLGGDGGSGGKGARSITPEDPPPQQLPQQPPAPHAHAHAQPPPQQPKAEPADAREERGGGGDGRPQGTARAPRRGVAPIGAGGGGGGGALVGGLSGASGSGGASSSSRQLVGCGVRKKFSGRYFSGKIIREEEIEDHNGNNNNNKNSKKNNGGLSVSKYIAYLVEYEDGDSEHVTREEAERIVVRSYREERPRGPDEEDATR